MNDVAESRDTSLGARTMGARWEAVNHVFFWVAWLIVAATIATAVLRTLDVPLANWYVRWVVPVLATAAVGYLTNWLAIQMLFVPYRPEDTHWLRLVTLGLWRQGVIPARRSDLAATVSRELVTTLLTPERVGNELTEIARRLIGQLSTRHAVRSYLGPLIREHLPGLVDRLTPEVMTLIREATRRGFSRDSLIRFTEATLEPWLRDRETRGRIVQLIVTQLQDLAPVIRNEIEELARRYAERSWLRQFALGLAELLNVVDWDDLEVELYNQLDSRETRARIYEAVGDFAGKFREFLERTDLDPAIRRLEQNVSDYIAINVEQFLRDELPEICNRLADSPALWRWIEEQAIPELGRRVEDWLAAGGSTKIVELLDIERLAREGLDRLSVQELHERANRLAGPELAAIQVLGFIIGAVAGALLAVALPV